jgi:hypothetical protein
LPCFTSPCFTSPCFTSPCFSVSKALAGASMVDVVPSHAMNEPRPMAMTMNKRDRSPCRHRMLAVSATRIHLASPVITRHAVGGFPPVRNLKNMPSFPLPTFSTAASLAYSACGSIFVFFPTRSCRPSSRQGLTELRIGFHTLIWDSGHVTRWVFVAISRHFTTTTLTLSNSGTSGGR